jgi:hypothetical protein
MLPQFPCFPFYLVIYLKVEPWPNTIQKTWGAIGNLENSLGTWWEPLLFLKKRTSCGSSSLRLPCIADDCTHSRRLAWAARKAQAPWSCLFDAPWTTIPESVVTTWWRSKRTFIFANSFYICSHFFFVCISFLLWSSVDPSQYSSLFTWVFSKSLNWSKS